MSAQRHRGRELPLVVVCRSTEIQKPDVKVLHTAKLFYYKTSGSKQTRAQRQDHVLGALDHDIRKLNVAVADTLHMYESDCSPERNAHQIPFKMVDSFIPKQTRGCSKP